MELADFYPAPSDLIKSEEAVLEHLRNNTYITEHQPQVARDAGAYYDRNRGSRSEFDFHTHFDVWHPSMRRGKPDRRGERSGPNVRLTVSARVEWAKKVIQNVTYCLSVCRIRPRTSPVRVRVLRKFHFDVVGKAGASRSQEHPRCHLQYGGKLVPYMETIGCVTAQLEELHPWLSEPRISYWPMSLALLIDMALHEFPDQRSVKFRADSHWRGLVHHQEDLLLKPFYRKCIEVIEFGSGKNRILADVFYVA